MNYNERLAEIIGSKDDRIYRETAEAIRKSNFDFYDYYSKYKRVPRLSNVNRYVAEKGIKQLQKELNEKNKGDLSSLMLAETISSNFSNLV